MRFEKDDDFEQQPPAVPQSSSYRPPLDDEIDLLEYWRVIYKSWLFIALLTTFCTLLAVIVVLFVLPVKYKSVAVLQPVSAGQNPVGNLSSLTGGLSSLLGFRGGDSKAQEIADFLKSRSIKQRLLEKYDLMPRLYEEKWDPKKKTWRNENVAERPSVIKTLQLGGLDKIFQVEISKKTDLVTLSWIDEDPGFAAQMLDRTIGELSQYLEYEYESDAKRERLFTEAQLIKAKTDLEYWEDQLPSPQVSKGEIERELLASQIVYQELRKQLELAKIQEAKEIVSFKVLDPPFVPEIKDSPKRTFICAVTLALSGLFSVMIVLIRYSFSAEKRNGGNE